MFAGLSAAPPLSSRWTALVSFTLQVVFVAAVLLFPMLYPQSLPPIFLTRRIFVPVPPAEVHADVSTNARGSGGTGPAQVLVVSRRAISFREGAGRPATDPEAPHLGAGEADPAHLGFMSSGPTPLPPAPQPSASRTSVVMEGNLIRRVEPQYPAIARQIRLEGTVVLKAVISREGNIDQLEVASGPGLLALAAKDAVRQWKYRPYLLNGRPVEVETQITVNFVLGH